MRSSCQLKGSRPAGAIRIRRGHQNNLKHIDVDFPLGQFTVVTGVSGSGKSSLAFDTLYAEGQRRYVETFSPYARQFLDRLARPQAESIQGVLPAIAIDQTNPIKTSRSTVGTMTEINDHLKLLFAQAGVLFCDGCDQAVGRDDASSIFERVLDELGDSRIMLGFPVVAWEEVGAEQLGRVLKSQGIRRVFSAGRLVDLEHTPGAEIPSDALAIVDRVRLRRADQGRIVDSLELCLRSGLGALAIVAADGRVLPFSQGLSCPRCDRRFEAPTPQLFSFNSPLGACPTCRGFGRTIGIDPDLVVPDPELSLAQGAIRPWRSGFSQECQRDLMLFCRAQGLPVKRPFSKLSQRHRRWVMDGHGDFYGVAGYFEWLESRTYKMHVRVMLSRYRSYDRCEACQGARLRPEALRYRIGGLNLAELVQLPIDRASAFLADYTPQAPFHEALNEVLAELRERLGFLQEVGAGYLSLDRQSRTLSGGEVQRVDLARALGSPLVNTLYVLDEPSIGLHARDVRRLIGVLHGLRDRGNTVVVVEHDRDIIRAADRVIDLGPGPGEAGGRIIFAGSPAQLAKRKDSVTGRFLSDPGPSPGSKRSQRASRAGMSASVRVVGASEHNLDRLDVVFPLQCLVVVTGVSGSGKSTLIHDVLYRGARKAGGRADGPVGQCERIEGLEQVADVVMVDQASVPRTPSSNPVSYVKALTPIRQAFASTESAVRRGQGPGAFSHRSGEGRCETCSGAGFEKVEMQFLSDVYLPCPDCAGDRYKPEVLEVRYRNKNIADVMRLTVDEALEFFEDLRGVKVPLGRLTQVGLGYLRLGQAANTLSGGEAQRLKVAGQLGRAKKVGSLFLFDEPSIGLHAADVTTLLQVLQRLVEDGNSVVVIEHNQDVIRAADHVIDLGPEGGEGGGQIVFQGPPAALLADKHSHTAKALRGEFAREETKALAIVPKPKSIRVEKARQHNLAALDVEVPRNKLVAVTGVSGSGKSSLAFDVLFAEGQRRYLDSVSAYARQFISQLPRPEVERVLGLPPTVAVEQRTSRGSRRSSVATLSETYHYLRLLFAKAGVQHCPECGLLAEPQTQTRIVNRLLKEHAGQLISILAPVVRARKGHHGQVMAWAEKQGFTHGRIDGRRRRLSADLRLARYREHDVAVEVERLKMDARTRTRIRQAVELALRHGDGVLMVHAGRSEVTYSTRGACPGCGRGFPVLDPRMFSFNSPHGACPDCEGLGVIDSGAEESVPPQDCPACNGARLRPAARAVQVGGRTLTWLSEQSVAAAKRALEGLRLPKRLGPVADPLLAEIGSRLEFLERLGLGYLGLGRSGDSLSGGEAQRIRLAAQLGSTMRGVCYVVDEPTIGLHPVDSRRLVELLRDLRDRGNTVVVVEHDEQTILAADHVIDLGPGAGLHGGQVVAVGPPSSLASISASVTGRYLTGAVSTSADRPDRAPVAGAIQIKGANAHNLKRVSADFPLGRMSCVTGVSGSGKSSLVVDTLYRGVRSRLAGRDPSSAGVCRDLLGWEAVSRALLVDQAPIGRTPRSTVATYVGLFDGIRKLFAGLPEARVRGYGPARFSFNVSGGRCEACSGQGRIKLEMSFLANTSVACHRCSGRRFNSETLGVRYRGHSIADVLTSTAERALTLFAAVPELAAKLQMLNDVGLGYLQLGQTSPTLSGGEAQRLKLVSELSKAGQKRSLYVLEEPTTGLHPQDVEKLLRVLSRLVERGDTVVLVEHNLQLIAACDQLIDLGPEGGDRGGRVVARGSPGQVSKSRSHTGRVLAEAFAEAGSVAEAGSDPDT